MRERVRTGFGLHADGLHKPATTLGSVARVHIYMLAPETLRAVVGVSRALHARAAFLTSKVFYRARESHLF